MTTSHELGWGGDHVGKLIRLRMAVHVLAEGRGKTSDRLDRATFALVPLRPEDFPERLRKRARRVLGLREKAAAHVGDTTYFRFADMTTKEREKFVADLIALYEGCLIDLGRGWPVWDFMYPKSEPA